MSNENLKEVEKLPIRPFTRFCMSIGAVPSSYLAGLTIEEQLLWLCSYLEKEVIPAVNNNGEAVEELQGLYVELKNYVDNYFENLDVQEEINNKLDEMADDGTLLEILGNYVSIEKIYDSFADVLEDDEILENMKIKTLGYYTINDGGGATYKIVATTTNYAEDVPNSLKAELIVENDTINALQIGIKRNDNTYDSHTKILNIVQNYDYKLYFPKGTYYLSETFFNKNCHVNLQGESTCYAHNTIFKPYGVNNGYIIKCGGKADYTVDSLSDYSINILKKIKLNGITFSDKENHIDATKYPYYCCLAIDNCSDVELNVNFLECNANGLLIRESWEIQSDWLSFRGMYGTFDTAGIIFANRAMTSSGSNISSLSFNLLDFEQINGKCIYTESKNANLTNSLINQIMIENTRSTSYTNLKSKKVADISMDEVDTYRSTYHFNGLIRIIGVSITINSISTGTCCVCYYYKDGDQSQGKYTDSLLDLGGSIAIGEISMPAVMTALLSSPWGTIAQTNSITISSFKSFASTINVYNKQIPSMVYLVPTEASERNGVTMYDIKEDTLIIDPDYTHEIVGGFWSNLKLSKFFKHLYGVNTFSLLDNKYCFNEFYGRPSGNAFQKIKIPAGKKLRLKVRPGSNSNIDAMQVKLLDNSDTVVSTINSGNTSWTGGNWYDISFTIPDTAYERLDFYCGIAFAIEWISIE